MGVFERSYRCHQRQYWTDHVDKTMCRPFHWFHRPFSHIVFCFSDSPTEELRASLQSINNPSASIRLVISSIILKTTKKACNVEVFPKMLLIIRESFILLNEVVCCLHFCCFHITRKLASYKDELQICIKGLELRSITLFKVFIAMSSWCVGVLFLNSLTMSNIPFSSTHLRNIVIGFISIKLQWYFSTLTSFAARLEV